MTYPGAGPPPPGVTPNLEHPKDVLRTINFATQALTLVVVTGFVTARFIAKNRILRSSVTLDDYATYAAYVLMIGYCITGIVAGHHDGGYNIWEAREDQIEPFYQSCYAATLFYAPMAMTIKLALLIIIIRVFGSVHKRILIGVYVLIGIIVCYYISGFFIKMFICVPISAYWTGDASKCMNQSAIITADAIISVISDSAILLLPTPLTWSLRLPVQQRLRVSGMLAAGGIATGFSIYRLAMIVTNRNSPNMTIVFIKVILSGNAEIGIGLICACLPAVNAFFVRRKKDSSSYFKQSKASAVNGQILMTRSFHIETTITCTQDRGGDEETIVDVGLSHHDKSEQFESHEIPSLTSERSNSTYYG